MHASPQANGIAILNAAPYAGGVLAKGSARISKITYQDADESTLEPVRRIEQICAEHSIAPGAAAIQFSLQDPRIASTVVGVSKPERVVQTLDWAGAAIPDEAWLALKALDYSAQDPEANRVYLAG